MGSLCCSNLDSMPIPKKKSYGLCEYDDKTVYEIHITCNILCEECELDSYEKGFCISCGNNLKETEKQLIREKIFKKCELCEEEKKSARKQKCGCLLCKNCLEISNSKECSECPKCKEPLQDFIDLSGIIKSNCAICFSEFPREKMRTIECNHYFCESCLLGYIEGELDNRSSISENMKCPDPACTGTINYHTIQAILSKQSFDKYMEILLLNNNKIEECPNVGCGYKFITESEKIICRDCGYFFCVKCKRQFIQCICKNGDDFSSILAQLEKEGNVFSCCPGCKGPFLKDKGCDHVTCFNEQCKSVFCFDCSAYRSPTLEHGNHYHRPQCRFFTGYGGGDEFKKNCERCKLKGSLCQRPKNLKVPRRFLSGET
jgi:Zinc finger, C3HC4 type (RING finger)/IBR domain, a half RING-finger domain